MQYDKPTVSRLGTFRELTQAGANNQNFDGGVFVGFQDGQSRS